MPTLNLSNFSPGLDTRRSELTSKPGVLETLVNAHINSGGEIEKRKAFVPLYLPSGTGYTFGLQPLVGSLQVFGSAASGTVTPLPAGVTYLQLISPNISSPNMISVVSSTLFQNLAFVAAEFNDNYTYCFYGGSLVVDMTNGLVTSWQGTDNQIAAAIALMINNTALATNPVTGELVYTATAVGNIVEVFSTPTVASSQPFNITTTTTLQSGSTGTLTANIVTNGVASVAAVQAVGAFAILQGTAASGFATGTATVNNLAAYNGTPGTADVVNLGSNTYYFATSAYIAAHPTDPFAVLVGANTIASALNLSKAINGTGTIGTTYTAAMTINTQLSASPAAAVLTLTALSSGTAGNSVAMSLTVSSNGTYTLSGAHLSGGTNSDYIASVNVNGNNILSAQIPWDVTANQTAIDVVENINANTANNGGFTAITNGGVVNIFGPLTNAAVVNGQVVSVVVVGQIITQLAAFIVDTVANGNTVTSITVNGTTITSGTVTATGASQSTFAAALATNINGFSGTSGYIALAIGAEVYISPLTSSSANNLGSLVINGTGPTFTAGVSGALVVVLTTYSVAGATLYRTTTPQTSVPGNNITRYQFITSTVAAQPSGGIQPYNYKWTFAGSGNSQLVCQYPTSQTTAWFYTTNQATAGTNLTEQWICTVTDSTTPTPNVVASQPVTIYF